jgi:hypothetical protein
MAGLLSGEIRLGGRLFDVVRYEAITVINESYIHSLLRATGLDIPLPATDSESDAEYLVRMQARVIDTLRVHELLAGFLLPAGKTELDWSVEMARETAKYIAQLTDRTDRAEVFRLAFEMNLYFFQQGLASLGISPNASKPEAKTTSPPERTSRSAAGAVS